MAVGVNGGAVTATVDAARLGAMDELDSGAFGIVYRLRTYSLPGFTNLAYKEFTNSPSAEDIANLTALVEFRSALDARRRAVLDDAAAWPLRLVTRGGLVCGFVMQLIPPEFFGQQLLPSGRTIQLPVKSQWLVVEPAKADAGPSLRRSSAAKTGRCASVSGVRASTQNAKPRSKRASAAKPQCWAMSLALVDHGEIVPTRGTTKKSSPLGAGDRGASP